MKYLRILAAASSCAGSTSLRRDERARRSVLRLRPPPLLPLLPLLPPSPCCAAGRPVAARLGARADAQGAGEGVRGCAGEWLDGCMQRPRGWGGCARARTAARSNRSPGRWSRSRSRCSRQSRAPPCRQAARARPRPARDRTRTSPRKCSSPCRTSRAPASGARRRGDGRRASLGRRRGGVPLQRRAGGRRGGTARRRDGTARGEREGAGGGGGGGRARALPKKRTVASCFACCSACSEAKTR